MKISKREIAYLAGLLHDIGKFYQRADDNGARRSIELDTEVKNLETLYCPESHKHVLWTAQFIVDHESFFKEVTGSYYADFFKAAVAHHNPSGAFETLIQKADHYSSGVDRVKHDASREDAAREKRWDEFKNVRMVSVFEGLINENAIDKYKFHLPVSKISNTSDFFPAQEIVNPGHSGYNALWQKFDTEFSQLKPEGFRGIADTILSLLYKYTVTVPSSTIHLPDVSLYDHLKSVAAFSICLADFAEYLKTDPVNFKDLQPFLLIGGDLSGIQSYLYDIISKDASKNLKGRSFYLNMLLDNVISLLLKELNLYYGNVVYASGGSFYIIAPNTTSVKNKLDDFVQSISLRLLKNKGISLFLAIDFQEFGEKELFSKDITGVWMVLAEKLGSLKRKKYARQLVADYDSYFEPAEIGGQALRDIITGEEIKKGEAFQYIDDEEDKPVSDATYNQILLGKQLRQDTRFWVASFEALPHWRDNKVFQAAGLPVFNYFVSSDDLENQKTYLRASADNVRIQAINETDFLENAPDGNGNIYQFVFYGGSDVPRKSNGEPLTFDQLAGSETDNFRRLGFLRMDVDNLGAVFINGMEPEKRTFSRYSTISRSLDYFFKGYLNSLWRNDPLLKNNTSIIYSGGDDLFIVGKWDAVISFASTIREEFRRFTCNNGNLTLSGGLAIVGHRFPISKAADLAGYAEKKAKSHIYNKIEKNSFCLLDVPLNWDTEFPLVRDLKEQLKDWAKMNNNSLLRKILILHEMKNTASRNNSKSPESWRWMAAYDFARIAERNKGNDNRYFFDELKAGIFLEKNKLTDKYNFINDRHSFLDLVALAARWVELELKNIESTKI